MEQFVYWRSKFGMKFIEEVGHVEDDALQSRWPRLDTFTPTGVAMIPGDEVPDHYLLGQA